MQEKDIVKESFFGSMLNIGDIYNLITHYMQHIANNNNNNNNNENK